MPPFEVSPDIPLEDFDPSFSNGNDWLFPRTSHARDSGAEPAIASQRSDFPSPIRIKGDTINPSRTVKRVLEWYHIFFIAFSETVGVGIYVQGGSILRLGGPWALILSYLIMAILAWSIMQGLSEMLCIWPISGAIYEYVRSFVDPEVGDAIGLTYWFTISLGFAAILITTAGEIAFWSKYALYKVFVALFLPMILFGINCFGVKLYGWIELFGGSLKLSFAIAIIVATFAIVFGAGSDVDRNKNKNLVSMNWDADHFDNGAADSHFIAFLMCLSNAAFSYVGLEITVATALEAKAETRQQIVPTTRLKRPATKLPIVVGVLYILAAVAISLAVDSRSSNLPRQPWLDMTTGTSTNASKSDSAFVQAAETAKIAALPSIITAFIIFTAVTASNTALYVASRTLFSLAREHGSWFGYFGTTSDTTRVPQRALCVSSLFGFLAFFSLLETDGVAKVSTVLSNMSAGSAIIVWGFESVAFLRYYYCIKRHAEKLESEPEITPPLRRFYKGSPEAGKTNYPWKSHGQPFTAFLAVFGCVFITFISNQASLWSRFHWLPFVSNFLAPIIFILLVIILKMNRYKYKKWDPRSWSWGVNLEHYDEVLHILLRLQKIRTNSIPVPASIGAPAAVTENSIFASRRNLSEGR